MGDHHGDRSSTASHLSISDTDSQLDEFYTPIRSDLTLPSKAIIAVDKYQTTFRSPLSNHQKPPQTLHVAPLAKSHSPPSNLSAKQELAPTSVEDRSGGGGGAGNRRSRAPVASVVRRTKRELTIKRAELGFRVCEMIFSLIAFSVMAADKTQGWSGDSFERYKEYRYLVAVNVIAFVYAAFQAIDLTYHLIYERHIISSSLHGRFDFLLDQISAYLLISASSSAATRVDDWVLNWGKDKFTETATASVGMSFLAFLGFALSSLVSGYNICHQSHT